MAKVVLQPLVHDPSPVQRAGVLVASRSALLYSLAHDLVEQAMQDHLLHTPGP
jgi:hypothetical protein